MAVRGQPNSLAELVTNSTFAAGGTGWNVMGNDATHLVTFTTGSMRYQSDTVSPILTVANQSQLAVGQVYNFTFTVSTYVSGSLKCDSIGGGAIVLNGPGTFKFTGVATNSTISLYRNTTNVDMTLSMVSVQQVSGHRKRGAR